MVIAKTETTMKTKHILGSLTAAALLLQAAGCSDTAETPSSPVSENAGTFLTIDIDMPSGTRGVITSTYFTEGDEVLVRVEDNEHNTFECQKATYQGGNWVFEKRIDLSESPAGSDIHWSDNLTVMVMYPYAKFAEAGQVPSANGLVVEKITGILDQDDLLFGTAYEVSWAHPYASITARHLLSRLTFEFINETPEELEMHYLKASNKPAVLRKDGEIIDTIYLPWMAENASLWRDGYLDCTGSGESAIVMENGLYLPPYNGASSDLLVSPMSEYLEAMVEKAYWTANQHDISFESISTGIQVDFQVNEFSFSFVLDRPNYNSGQQYTYPVRIRKNNLGIPDLMIGDVVVEPWKANESGDINVID